jgi:hypothetical protein
MFVMMNAARFAVGMQGERRVALSARTKIDREQWGLTWNVGLEAGGVLVGKEIRIVEGASSLATLVNGLNALGVSPRDMISILQAVKAAGALQAEIEVL